MRIALYVHCFFPAHFYGTEAYTLTLAKELAALGHEPVVISATLAGESPQGQLIEQYYYDGVQVLSIDKNLYPDRSVRDTYEQPGLRHVHERVLRKLQPDIVHVCHLISHTTALLEVTRRMRIPTFATLTDFFGFCYNNRLEAGDGSLCPGPDTLRANCIACFLKLEAQRPGAESLTKLANLPLARPLVSYGLGWLGRRENDPFVINGFTPNDIVIRPAILARAMGTYHQAIAPTQFLKDAYEQNGFPAPLRISHFGIDIDRRVKPPRAEARVVCLGFIGQLLPHKGVHLLLEALRRCGRSNLHLRIWGSHEQNPGYAERLRTQGQSLPVTFHGTIPRTELAGALGSLDYLVIPSTWYENSPLILLQALATHTPVIISDVLGMTEFVQHEHNGLHFTRGDVDSLANVLQRVADDGELARSLSAAAAYDRVPADMARDVLDMYASHGLAGQAPEPVTPPHPVGAHPLDRGIEGDLNEWLRFNRVAAFENQDGRLRVAPFAPNALMRDTTSLDRIEDFASHGADIVHALAATTSRPLPSFRSWLDFGVGVGRLARMFKGFRGRYTGVDIDPRNIAWVQRNLPWVEAVRTVPGQRLPFADRLFDMIVSISVFTHMNEAEQTFYLAELHRVARPGAHVVITTHGERALERAVNDDAVRAILGIDAATLAEAGTSLSRGAGFHFVRQAGHLTNDDYDYGVTFLSQRWIDSVWSNWYEIVMIVPGGIHDFQDLVILRPRLL